MSQESPAETDMCTQVSVADPSKDVMPQLKARPKRLRPKKAHQHNQPKKKDVTDHKILDAIIACDKQQPAIDDLGAERSVSGCNYKALQQEAAGLDQNQNRRAAICC